MGDGVKAEGTRVRLALLVLLALSAAAVFGAPRTSVRAAGEGIFELDKVAYETPEGTAVFVTVKRTSGATLTNDVLVQLELEGGTTNVEYPASEQTKLVTFPKNTNLTQQGVFIQTLNQNRFSDYENLFVTIRSVSAGGQIGAISSARITLRGTNAPRVTDISPRSAGTLPQPAGGETIVITGVNFLQPGISQATAISFVPVSNLGATATPLAPCGTFSVISNTQILLRIAAPTALCAEFPLSQGLPHHLLVTVTDAANQLWTSTPDSLFRNDLFVYTTGPTITQVFPKSGTAAGGTQVRITGRGFTGSPGAQCSSAISSVLFGGVAATSCVYDGPDTIVAVTPPRSPGKVDVVLIVPAKPPSPATSDSQYEYTQGPTITGLSPNFGPPSGGNTVVITGANFLLGAQQPSQILFGGTPSPAFVVENDTRIVATAPPGTGIQQVTIVHPVSGASPFNSNANYGYSAGPIIASISPDSGPVVGGTVVTITGTGFLPGATVRFGATLATFATVVSPTQINVTSPAGTGVVDVVVTVGAETSPTGPQARFSYSGPTVESVAPIAGPLAGGGTITIKGTNFNSQSRVRFGAVTVTPTYLDPTTLTAVVPASPIAQAVHVRVVNSALGDEQVSPETPDDLYTYTNGPIVDLVNPNNGPTTGGTIVIIIGKNFTAPLSLSFGGQPVEAFNINSATQITLLSPSNGTPGAVDVRVTKGSDVSPVGPATKFTYNSAVPKITALTPNTGSTFGGNEVVFTGIGFTGAACPGSVKFGTVQASECTVINDTTMTAKAPPNVAGATVVLVTTQNGTSDIVPNYTYVSPSGSAGGSTAPPAPGPGGNESYTLTYRWSLLTWTGRDGMTVSDAVHGTGVPGASDLSARITALFQWDAAAAEWKAYFVGSDGVPGANDFTTLTQGSVYWVAISGEGTVPWVVPLN